MERIGAKYHYILRIVSMTYNESVLLINITLRMIKNYIVIIMHLLWPWESIIILKMKKKLKLSSVVDIVVPWVEPLLVLLVSPAGVLAIPLLSQHSADVCGKAAEECPSVDPCPHSGYWNEAPGFDLPHTCLLWTFREWTSKWKNQPLSFPFSFSLCFPNK